MDVYNLFSHDPEGELIVTTNVIMKRKTSIANK